MSVSVPKVGIFSSYFALFEEQMPPGFRDDRAATARGYAELLAREFDVADAGMLASDADGDRANAGPTSSSSPRRWPRRRVTPPARSRGSTLRS